MAGTVKAGDLEAILRLRDELTPAVRKMKADVGSQMQSIGREMQAVGGKMTTSLTLPIVAFGGAAVKTFLDFDRALVRINTLVGISTDDMAGWREEILAISGATAVGPAELADALFVVTSAGARGSEALSILESAAKASAVGLGDTGEIARAVTSAVQAYGSESLSASTATDVLTATVRAGNLEASALSGSLGRVIGIAAQVGVTFQDVGAFVATFTRLGVSAEESVTALRGVLSGLINPTSDSAKALAEAGFSAEQLRTKIREEGLAQTLVDLVAAFDGNEEALARVIPNVRALSGVLGTAGTQGEAFQQISTEINESLGITQGAFDETAKSAGFAFDQILNQARVVGTELGGPLSDALVNVIEAAKPLVETAADTASGFNELSTETQGTIVKVLLMTAAIGPLWNWIGRLVEIFGTLVKWLGLSRLSMGSIGLVLVTMTGYFKAANAIVQKSAELGALWREHHEPIANETLPDLTDELNTFTNEGLRPAMEAEQLLASQTGDLDGQLGMIAGSGLPKATKSTVTLSEEVVKLRDEISGTKLVGDLKTLESAWLALTPAQQGNEKIVKRVLTEYGKLRAELGLTSAALDRLARVTGGVEVEVVDAADALRAISLGMTESERNTVLAADAIRGMAQDDFPELIIATRESETTLDSWLRQMGNVEKKVGGLRGMFGGVVDFFKGGIADIGRGFLEGIGNSLLGGLQGLLSTGLSALVGGIKRLFSGRPVFEQIERSVKEWGITISEGLAKEIEATAGDVGDRVAAQLLHINQIFAEAGGVTAANFEMATARARDLFVMIETGKLTVEQVTPVFNEMFQSLLANFDSASASGQAMFLELAELAGRFGVDIQGVTEQINAMITASTNAAVDAVVRFVDNATFTTQEGARGAVNAVTALFQQMIANGATVQEALAALGPTVLDLKAKLKDAGLQGTQAFRDLVRQSRIMADEVKGPLVQSVLDVNEVLINMNAAGLLNRQTFRDLSTQVFDTFKELKAEGVKGRDALALMQPTLQTLWEMHTDLGFPIDENTKKLIDQGLKAGVIGEEHRDAADIAAAAQQRMLDVLVLVARALGVAEEELAALGTTGETTGGQLQAGIEGADTSMTTFRQNFASDAQLVREDQQAIIDNFSGTPNSLVETLDDPVRTAFDDFEENARLALNNNENNARDLGTAVGDIQGELDSVDWEAFADEAVTQLGRVEEAVNAISFGHSPGGIDEIPHQLDIAGEAMGDFANRTDREMTRALGRVNSVRDGVASLGLTEAFASLSRAGGIATEQALAAGLSIPRAITALRSRIAELRSDDSNAGDIARLERQIRLLGMGQTSFAAGSGRMIDFGRGTPVVLHGREQVVTSAEGADIVSMVREATRGASSQPVTVNILIDPRSGTARTLDRQDFRQIQRALNARVIRVPEDASVQRTT